MGVKVWMLTDGSRWVQVMDRGTQKRCTGQGQVEIGLKVVEVWAWDETMWQTIMGGDDNGR